VPNKLPAKPDNDAAMTTDNATRITVAITGEIALLDLFSPFPKKDPRVLLPCIFFTDSKNWF
jgi:hypothetical protein